MPFEEQLRRTFDTVADRLRDELARQLEGVKSELAAAAGEDRAAAVAEAARDARTEAEREAADRQQTLTSEAAAEAQRLARESIAAQLAEAEARSHAAGHEAGREAGQSEGHAAGRNEARAEHILEGERLADAIRSLDRARTLSEILDVLALWASRVCERAALFLVQGADVRTWRRINFGPEAEGNARADMPAAEAALIADAARTAAPQWNDGRAMLAVPLALSGHVVAVLYGDQGDTEPAERPLDTVARATLEVMARHAARCLEAVTASKAAHLAEEESGAAAVPPSQSVVEPASAEDPFGVEEDLAARRYARLLVSEIRLYHEAEVMAGRRERDLSVRLGGEIARARVLYEQRVPAHVRLTSDHFQAELVRTLADGDASLMGDRVEGHR